jgi:hypothetical protein
MENNLMNQIQSSKNLILFVVAMLAIAVLVITLASKYIKPVRIETIIEGCGSGDKFSTTTGKPCDGGEAPVPCQEGDIYNIDTGELCPN